MKPSIIFATAMTWLIGLATTLVSLPAAPVVPSASAHTVGPSTPSPSAETDTIASRTITVGFNVSDMARAAAFFTDVLDFEKRSDVEVAGPEIEHATGVFGARIRVCQLALGDETIELTEWLAPRGRAIPADSRSNDLWFQHIAIITSDMERAYQRLREHGVRHASTGPQRLPEWNRSAGGIEAFYFFDPDGHVLEVLEFPPDRGDPKWHQLAQRDSGRLFLGIDHTAIVVSDTERSLGFYRDLLGMEIAGTSENYGTEQEHLNNVFGARLRITSLRCAGGGPALELLEYLSPRDGRPYPIDARANDLVHWQTTLEIGDVNRAEAATRTARVFWLSPGFVDVRSAPLGFNQSLLIRDPDGHAIRLIHGAAPGAAAARSTMP